jgi:hypothetical protein
MWRYGGIGARHRSMRCLRSVLGVGRGRCWYFVDMGAGMVVVWRRVMEL